MNPTALARLFRERQLEGPEGVLEPRRALLTRKSLLLFTDDLVLKLRRPREAGPYDWHDASAMSVRYMLIARERWFGRQLNEGVYLEDCVLRADPECPLPFGAKARNLYSEVVVQAPAMPDPFLALDDGDRSPLGRRLLAAKGAGLVITAESVLTTSHARTLAIAGFDRGGGPFAEAGLR